MSRLHPPNGSKTPASPFGCGGRGARYVEKLERYPAREPEPGVVRRARALVRAVLGLSARGAPGATPKRGGETR